MRSNRLDSFLGITTFGESHGPALGLVIEDIKPNLDFPYDELNRLLAQRKPHTTVYSSTRKETDEYQIISGVFEGKTTGMPICILFWNQDAQSEDYEILKDVFRPGHADYPWFHKFKIYDYRGGGRASGRETISRVAGSALVSKFTDAISIKFQTIQIGIFRAENQSQFYQINKSNPFCWAEQNRVDELYSYLDAIKGEQDTVGGIIRVRFDNVPIGLGDPVIGKLSANLAKAIVSIGSIKGISFGDGFEIVTMKGSEANDQMDETGFLSNHSGGITGGISTGQPIIINIAVKPISSHGKSQKTIDKEGRPIDINISGRHDVCHISRILPVIEAMIKLTLADALFWQKRIDGTELNLADYREMIDKIDEDLLLLLYRRKEVVNLVRDFKMQQNMSFRDDAREQELAVKWLEIARELNLPENLASDLLSLVLNLCRYDNTINPVQE